MIRNEMRIQNIHILVYELHLVPLLPNIKITISFVDVHSIQKSQHHSIKNSRKSNECVKNLHFSLLQLMVVSSGYGMNFVCS